MAQALQSISVTQLIHYRLRKEIGGLKAERVMRLKELETDRAVVAPLVRACGRGSGLARRSPS